MTIREALDGWYLHLRADNASPRTLDRYARVWRFFAACWPSAASPRLRSSGPSTRARTCSRGWAR